MNEDTARSVIEEVLGTIAPEADLGALDPGAQLQEELDLDSMNFIDFMTGIHTRTGIDIPERDYPMVATMDGCVSYLCNHAPV